MATDTPACRSSRDATKQHRVDPISRLHSTDASRKSASQSVTASLARLNTFLWPLLLPHVHDHATFINLLVLSKEVAGRLSCLRANWYASWCLRACDGNRESALVKAACVGHVDACRGLIDGGARLPTAWRRPLEPVFERDSRDVLALLLDRGLYTLDCPDGKETIYDIEKHGSWDILGMYLARGWNHRQDYTTLDAAAVQRGELGNLKQLMELGVCPYGDLLIEAALSGHTEIVMYLLEDQEWNPQWADEYDRDVLEIAASCGDVDMLAALLERGVHRYPEERWSIHAAMVQAQHYRNLDMVRLMVTHGYYDMTFEAGDEVLEWAVEHGDVELVEFLLDAGAGVQPVLGRALRVAIELGKSDMERALRRLCDEPVDGSTASPPPSDYLEDPEWWGTDWRLRRGPQKPLSYRRLDIRP